MKVKLCISNEILMPILFSYIFLLIITVIRNRRGKHNKNLWSFEITI